MKYFIASDHAGTILKELIKDILNKENIEIIDMGPNSKDRVDYPDFAKLVCEEVQKDKSHFGILVCGSGIGMSMAANKFDKIRAALCHNIYSAKMAREHNDANVLCLGERVSGEGMIEEIIKAWLNSSFEGGRHKERVEKINNLFSCRV
ncbi:putative sugar phosphate isomerase YwlF [Aliarcobacter thereius]|uniref:Sugar phosphate isomerase YwlF n=2 Tax=Aliarcobacter thereius TaxID=544718 RepID=A0A1C7WTR0_9BACT|nr:ribose 5-phosphate isomerase B [Aliarcobacter thereius]OCL86742.1 putative sugar phosphate isomerase YwlF [Aliarcobacter thereius]OCL90944.1 putative sugar phosphate isomerase YwlF [Aliarcobacter thereius]OCL96227.1 putative sugar phosphate isomerase YwlF [Aliarcobacter thereius LMG 24486]OCL98911.1 putative sugar phosphate isomerase YwlF [Aliarcobacter thereius]QBF15808.1 allose-6-phosphate isomerase / ribose-5-phosphate isomerase B [Aliarcobacter thereius LMG 24486]